MGAGVKARDWLERVLVWCVAAALAALIALLAGRPRWVVLDEAELSARVTRDAGCVRGVSAAEGA